VATFYFLIGGHDVFYHVKRWLQSSFFEQTLNFFLSPTNFLSFSIVLARSQALSFLQAFILYYKLSIFQWFQ